MKIDSARNISSGFGKIFLRGKILRGNNISIFQLEKTTRKPVLYFYCSSKHGHETEKTSKLIDDCERSMFKATCLLLIIRKKS